MENEIVYELMHFTTHTTQWLYSIGFLKLFSILNRTRTQYLILKGRMYVPFGENRLPYLSIIDKLVRILGVIKSICNKRKISFS